MTHDDLTHRPPATQTEWPTLGIAALVYAGFILVLLFGAWLGVGLSILLLALTMALHSSLQHEVLHGHPFAQRWANEALVFLPLGLLVPYGRFRDTHLAHHFDPNLTDPYDDPESQFADPVIWAALPQWRQRLGRANNTLFGRLVFGPAMALTCFYRGDLRLMAGGERRVIRAYVAHCFGVTLVIGVWLGVSGQSLWVLLGAAYVAMSIIRIRTFLEHRAHEVARGRTVIIEDRGVLAFLFLNNNLHAVHHAHPNVPWYRLWQLYRSNKAGFLRRNDGYIYKSYAQVFRLYFWRVKDPVPHPLMPLAGGALLCEPVHPLGPLQSDKRAFDAGQHPQA